MLFMTFNEVINLIKESGVKEYEHIIYSNDSWKIKFQQLGNKNNCIVFYGRIALENVYIVPNPNTSTKNYDKHVLESIIKGDGFDDITHINMVYISDEEDNKDE